MWNIDSSSGQSFPEQWKILESVSDFQSALNESSEKPVVIFKHSTRCGISTSAKRRLINEFSSIEDDVQFYYLDLLRHRDVSNLIAEKLSVIHQSPQVLLIADEKVKFHSSHEGVSAIGIKSAMYQS